MTTPAGITAGPGPNGGGVPQHYPQYGLMPSSGQIVAAQNGTQKVADIEKGYVQWYQTRQAAENAYKGEQGFFGTGSVDIAALIPGLSGLIELGHWIGDFIAHITDLYMWISLGWISLGLVLLVVGILMWLRKADLIPSAVPVPV